MTDYANAEKMRTYYIMHPVKVEKNICTGRRDWNVCDYGDIYAGAGLPCWKQDGPHYCAWCHRVTA